MRNVAKPIGLPLALLAAIAAPTGGVLPAAAQTVSGPTGILQINTGRGRLVTLDAPITDVFVANPGVADVQVRSVSQIYVFGKSAGETTIYATSKSGRVVYATTVRIGNNIDSIDSMLRLAMPDAKIVATPMNGMVLLTGTVGAPADVAEAERLVQAFTGKETQVISRLKTATPLQVQLQVRFAEVSRSFVKNVGVNLLTQDNTSGFQFGIASGRTPGTFGTSTTSATFTSGSENGTIGIAGKLFGLDILSALDLGETLGQVTTLTNPNLTAISGETSSFLAGGEIPIPVSQGLGAVSVEYKQYGVGLSYTPTVLADGRISLHVRPEVSALSAAGAVTISGTQIPALTTRRAETTVELGSGESMVIAGLMQNSHDNSITKTPGLGDVPVLGALFRSNAFKRNETELVIVITPYLVKPVNANEIVLPTDGYKAPDDFQRLIGGQLGGTTPGGERPTPKMAPPANTAPAVGAMAPVAPAAPSPRPTDAPVKAEPPKSKSKKGGSAAPGFGF
ncbi:type II and III secretion system protein family protein [Sphingomonas hengshuiensis]|uniref:Secretion system protein n=1 Tax=Sphingomonas hengshuiensis TaxID=1609977 RepID=A0A7U5BEQ5_9SPHN|nr:type II and III secretion system protein family protein [Sphingomonas hengshuiensis]AJP70928.1 secretion system protein [Sphingomonas hengshuiensis]